VRGGTGPAGTFRSGDVISVDYTLKRKDGSAWNLSEMSIARALVSGPTFNYQRVIAESADVALRSVAPRRLVPSRTRSRFRFPPRICRRSTTRRRSGRSTARGRERRLLDGTYTVGLTFAWEYEVEHVPFRDAAKRPPTSSMATTRRSRRATFARQANCDQCHVTLQAHQGLHRNFTLCLLCHTSGAEDANDPLIAGGTPGVSVDARVLFHALHNGSHLPSGARRRRRSAGNLDYDVDARRYVLVDSRGSEHDFSDVRYPVWPNRTIAMPRDFGYSALSADAKAKDEQVRKGVNRLQRVSRRSRRRRSAHRAGARRRRIRGADAPRVRRVSRRRALGSGLPGELPDHASAARRLRCARSATDSSEVRWR
jgi:hypothetical protein